MANIEYWIASIEAAISAAEHKRRQDIMFADNKVSAEHFQLLPVVDDEGILHCRKCQRKVQMKDIHQ